MASPIEEAFAVALQKAIDRVPPRDEAGWPDAIFVQRQAEVPEARCVADFLLEHASGVQLVVECDGHDFHERTREQASRDRARDRRLQAAGYFVFRFTGSDIHWDADAYANECVDFLLKQTRLERRKYRRARDTEKRLIQRDLCLMAEAGLVGAVERGRMSSDALMTLLNGAA